MASSDVASVARGDHDADPAAASMSAPSRSRDADAAAAAALKDPAVMKALMQNQPLMRSLATTFATQMTDVLQGQMGSKTSIVGVLVNDPSLGGIDVGRMAPVSMDTFRDMLAADMIRMPKDGRLAGVFKAYRYKVDPSTGKVIKKDGKPQFDTEDGPEVYLPAEYSSAKNLEHVKKTLGKLDDASLAEVMVMASRVLGDKFNLDLSMKCAGHFTRAVETDGDAKEMCNADGECHFKRGACIPKDTASAKASKDVLKELKAARAEKALQEARREEDEEAAELMKRLTVQDADDDDSSDDEGF